MSQQCWIGTVSKEHVLRGKELGFAQVCHGKEAPLKRMNANDIFIYYSPNEKFGTKLPYQCFTALGIVLPKETYQVSMTDDFMPFRRDIHYFATKDVPIRPLIPSLSFIKDKSRWGGVFRFGILKIPKNDAMIIASSMGLAHDQINKFFI